MKRKIVFLDVDGTLIDYEAKCPDSAKEAVRKAREAGHKVYICTGCSKAEILQRDLPALDGMIGGNGAYVEDDGQVVMHQGLRRSRPGILWTGAESGDWGCTSRAMPGCSVTTT